MTTTSTSRARRLASPPDPESETAADDLLAELFRSHYTSTLRLACLLLRDRAQAEEVVQEAYVALHAALPRLRDQGAAVAYLRRSVTNGCHSAGRRMVVAHRHRPPPPEPAASPETAVLGRFATEAVLVAVRALPRRQRECLVLRYYAELSEAETAEALDISVGSVKTHTHRALARMASTLENDR